MTSTTAGVLTITTADISKVGTYKIIVTESVSDSQSYNSCSSPTPSADVATTCLTTTP